METTHAGDGPPVAEGVFGRIFDFLSEGGVVLGPRRASHQFHAVGESVFQPDSDILTGIPTIVVRFYWVELILGYFTSWSIRWK